MCRGGGLFCQCTVDVEAAEVEDLLGLEAGGEPALEDE